MYKKDKETEKRDTELSNFRDFRIHNKDTKIKIKKSKL